MRDLRMYILINEDIKINKGKLAGQVGHAVSSYFYQTWKEWVHTMEINPVVKEYMEIQKKIILFTSQSILERLESEGYIAIRDKGFTDLPPNTLTCVNLGLIEPNNIPKGLEFIKDLKLVR